MINDHDTTYQELVNLVLKTGKVKKNRTGIDTIGVFGAMAKFDLAKGFPLLTTKKVFFKGVVHELLWFIKGDTNIKYLVDHDVNIWNEWAHQKFLANTHNPRLSLGEFVSLVKNNPTDSPWVQTNGDLGEGTYGGMWRRFPYYENYSTLAPAEGADTLAFVDQLMRVVSTLQTNPDDRRMIVSAWHPYWVEHCALPPCHLLFHFNTEELTQEERWTLYRTMNGLGWAPQSLDEKILDGVNVPKRRLNCALYQRSCDLGLGVPFNIASYSLLTQLVAHCLNMAPGVFTHFYGDLHIYQNHVEVLKDQIQRSSFEAPTVLVSQSKAYRNGIFNLEYSDISLIGYESHASVKMDVAV